MIIKDREASARKSIVRTFETVCLMGDWLTIATGVLVPVVGIATGYHPILAVLAGVVIYVLAALIFGGALALVDIARSLEELVALARQAYTPVSAGVFGAHMQVSLVNDGPVTVIVEI